MADLGELLGTLLSSLAHARRIADEETTAIAEYYRENPLLEGMSLPRIRVPELTLEFPILIQSHEAGEAHVPTDPKVLLEAVSKQLKAEMTARKLRLPATFFSLFEKEFARALSLTTPPAGGQRFPREIAVRAADSAFTSTIKQAARAEITGEIYKYTLTVLRKTAADNALQIVGTPPHIEASIMTAEVKENADPNSAARLRIVMKEEGLEWSIGESDDGTRRATLTPE
jgi:hypothetical protein